ncbi:MAG: GxxExxY protein, partial [Anaerolineales bacterium]|nr:GxxExxY protein [Anaerolineales bacterium]
MQIPNNFNSRKEPSKEVDELARLVIGAAIEVHKTLGPGYVENVYERALKIELEMRKTLYENQLSINVAYKGHPVGKGRLDFLVAKLLPVEIKAVSVLLPVHQAQLISYLKMTGLQLGLLINFNVPLLKNGIKRVIFNS